ncbi:DUF456 domain-containing protein [Arenibacter sp. TNZ]|uniref:DUF456 domain-containing protein n=1 Tax=Arenibacter TaxID=178469 RepID=UPI000CD3F3E0|nr:MULTISPECIES: DUF456 domain-containing protein [Arenibacter]MCM4171099.1 DUF456 domain-containing protein [Arenibacter sp. TNZ]
MTLKNAFNFFESLKTESTKKSEIKVYEKFVYNLRVLRNREFSEDEIQSLEMELDSLNLKSNPENRTKFFKKALSKFEKYLKDTFSLTSKGYYTNLSVSLGVLFGVVFGVLIGERFEKSLGISFGICIGMFIGAFIGRRKDSQAKEAGNML